MWPVQTLTLLLCLTEEEQLFAQCIPVIDEVPAVELTIEAPEALLKENEEAAA